MRVECVEVEGEGFDFSESRDRQIARPLRIDSKSAAKFPFGIVLLDELTGRLDHGARQREPVKIPDHNAASRPEPSARLSRRARTIEPMPALTSRHQIEIRRRKPSLLGWSFKVLDAHARRSIQFSRLLHQRNRSIERGDVASSERETASDSPGARAEIERANSVAYNSHSSQPIEKFVGGTGAMPPVVIRGFAEICAQLLVRDLR